jgi:ferredoxin
MTERHEVELILPDGATARLEVSADESVWDAATRAGNRLPSMCLQGWCTTCAGRVLAGEFDPAEALRYYPQDKAAGYILLCTARPRSAMRILTHQRDAMRTHRRRHGLPAPRG